MRYAKGVVPSTRWKTRQHSPLLIWSESAISLSRNTLHIISVNIVRQSFYSLLVGERHEAAAGQDLFVVLYYTCHIFSIIAYISIS